MRCDTLPVHANGGDFHRAANEQIGTATKFYWYHGEFMTIREHVWPVYISCVELSTNLVGLIYLNTKMEQ